MHDILLNEKNILNEIKLNELEFVSAACQLKHQNCNISSSLELDTDRQSWAELDIDILNMTGWHLTSTQHWPLDQNVKTNDYLWNYNFGREKM